MTARSVTPRRRKSVKRKEGVEGGGEAAEVGRVEPPQAFLEETDSPFHWMYTPNTITGLVLVGLIVIYAAFPSWFGQEESVEGDVLLRKGVVICCLVFLAYCAIQLRDSLLVRPHPSLWRVVHGVGIIYLMFVVFLLLQTKAQAVATFHTLVPGLGNRNSAAESNAKEYGGDCRLYLSGEENPWKNLWETVDIFFLAHLLGWVGKAIMIRDWTLLLVLNVSWELVEYSFQPKLLNFYECWWDHWLLDGLLCNLGGAWIGMQLVHYLEIHPYSWLGFAPSKKTKKVREEEEEEEENTSGVYEWRQVLSQLGPHHFVSYRWRVFAGWKQFLSVVFLLLFFMGFELSAFTLKAILEVPSESSVNAVRLVILWALAIPALHEWYMYVTTPAANRLGQNAWLAFAICAAELLFAAKHGSSLNFWAPEGKELPQVFHFRRPVLAGWPLFVGIGAVWAILRFYPALIRDDTLRRVTSNTLLALALLPLAFIVFSQEVYLGKNVSCSQGGVQPDANGCCVGSYHQACPQGIF